MLDKDVDVKLPTLVPDSDSSPHTRPLSARKPAKRIGDFQLVVRTVERLCLAFAALAACIVALDAFRPSPLADYVVITFCEALTLSAGAIAGFLVGHHHGVSTERQNGAIRDDSLAR